MPQESGRRRRVLVGSTAVSVFSSQRAKRAGWPKGLKGPEGTFRPFGPVGALRRRLLHRNGTFVTPAPSTPLRRQVKTDFRQKWAVAGPFFHQSGQFQGVRRPKFRCGRSRQFGFSRCTPETARFGQAAGKIELTAASAPKFRSIYPLESSGLIEKRPRYGPFSPKISFHLPTKRC